MQKQAPSIGRILVMVLFALSCFGILLYLWLVFGGSTPLKPQGYRVKVNFPEATQLAAGGRRAHLRACRSAASRRRSSTTRRHDVGRDRAGRAVRADPGRHARGPAPEDAARRDLRRADAGHEGRPDGAGRRRRWPRVRCRRPSSSTRSSARSTPKTREAFRVWLDQQGRAFEGRGEDINDALGNLRALRGGHERDPRDPRPPGARDAAARARHGRGLRGAHRTPGPAPAADRQLEPPLRDHRRARRRAGRHLPHLPDLPATSRGSRPTA